MEAKKLEGLQRKSAALNTEDFIAWAAARWHFAVASSISAEDQVLWHLVWQNFRQAASLRQQKVLSEPGIFSLDTGRLPQETYNCIEETEQFYGVRIELLFPAADDLRRLLRQGGPNLFYQGQMLRKLCCKFRKVEPLRRHLAQHVAGYGAQAAWLSGQRRSQSTTRQELQRLEWDAQFALVKLNPLADWDSERVWQYIREQQIPYNRLHDRNYPSIGCAPCTRAVSPGADERSGRWWWESAAQKECGIHIAADGQVERLSVQRGNAAPP